MHKRRLNLLFLAALIPVSCISAQRDDDTVGFQLQDPAAQLIARNQGPPMLSAQVPGAVTQTTVFPSGFRSIQQQCPPLVEETLGRPVFMQAEIGAEEPHSNEGASLNPYARSGCQP